jgi:electron transport complex protein RnfD
MSDRLQLLVQTSPFLRDGVTTPRLMRDVLVALVPVLGVAVFTFGLPALLVVTAAVLGAVGTEMLFTAGPRRRHVVADGSGLLTGLLLGLTLPPALPLWMAFLGGVAGMGLGKLVWGGLGGNLFNPALVGRAFLQAAFPISLTTWTAPGDPWRIHASNLALPLMQAPPDATSAATPLGLMKFEGEATELARLLGGNIAGSVGETSAAVILLAGVVLALRRTFDWRIPTSILLSVAALSAIVWALGAGPDPLFMLGSGGLLLGAVFMATDPVTSPITPRGAWIFGFGIGALVVLIRVWGGLPEGVMYAILLMNAATPLIERVAQQRVFGHGKPADAGSRS